MKLHSIAKRTLSLLCAAVMFLSPLAACAEQGGNAVFGVAVKRADEEITPFDFVDWGNWLLCCQKIYKNAEKPIAFDGHLWDNVRRFKDVGCNADRTGNTGGNTQWNSQDSEIQCAGTRRQFERCRPTSLARNTSSRI